MNIRRYAAGIALAFSLVLSVAPATLAASSTGSTPETLNIAATISMTVPTSVAYTQGKALNSTNVTVTNIATDNVNGLDLFLGVNAAGAMLINPASRSIGVGTAPTAPPTWIAKGPYAKPAFGSAGTPEVELLSSNAANGTPVTYTFASQVDASAYAPGNYTGSLNFRAATR